MGKRTEADNRDGNRIRRRRRSKLTFVDLDAQRRATTEIHMLASAFRQMVCHDGDEATELLAKAHGIELYKRNNKTPNEKAS